MSAIEIPPEYAEAWQHIGYQVAANLVVHPVIAGQVNNALVWALAGWMRSEFEREHIVLPWGILIEMERCEKCGVLGVDGKSDDPRHTWTDPDWETAARQKLEAKHDRAARAKLTEGR